ncbi:hypothetical protein [Polaribacter aquimarinus]|uniref:Uncharacterized protein n=1 Tax=Polaribacter aquimarinus TaxID=2100726 RepID=A0A2U2JBV3_9FLAO|nr:hypothetical protein [Polaribacter aquimarinus]PWG05820.1 hypothetical protein DIS07_05095 [Polaribacter aquimarinus]
MSHLTHMNVEQGDILSHLQGGCITIVGSPIDLKVCYSLNKQDETVTISVSLAGMSMGSATLSAKNPSVTLSLSLAIVKASITLKFDARNLKLSYTAKACYYAPFSWHCASHSGTIFNF